MKLDVKSLYNGKPAGAVRLTRVVGIVNRLVACRIFADRCGVLSWGGPFAGFIWEVGTY
jgi:hypothetical protein